MAAKPLPCPTLLRLLLDYDPQNGTFMWRPRPLWMFDGGRRQLNTCRVWNTRYAGKAVSRRESGTGHVFMMPMGKVILHHRAAWALTFGEWPNAEIDHINRDPSDNRIKNLRLATRSENACNYRPSRPSSSGFRGVAVRPNGRTWQAKIQVNGRKLNVGNFDNPEDAAKAYDVAAKLHHGEFAMLNFP